MPYFKNQPDVFDLGDPIEPMRRRRICHQVAVGVDEKSKSRCFEPKSDQKTSGLESARRLEEVTGQQTDRWHDTELPAILPSKDGSGERKEQELGHLSRQPETHPRGVHAAPVQPVTMSLRCSIGKTKPGNNLIVVGWIVQIFEKSFDILSQNLFHLSRVGDLLITVTPLGGQFC